ncbi:MAG TPA: hypothetical protein VLZ03_15225 [Thermodesulfobacteriota bacterium]|nr:hypothetical protein [Thermodesulfobacteriota bacterium]
MKKLTLVGIAVLGLFLVTGSVFAATTTAPLTISATVSSTAKLTLGVASIAFPNADPDITPSIAATQNPVSVTANAKTTTNGAVTLTVVTGGDLTDAGTDVIAIGNVTWTVTGTGFVAGTMNKTAAQSAGGWTGSGSRAGTFSYNLANSWSYPTGSYTATATYTLSCP